MTAFVSSVCFRVFDTDGDGFLSRSEIEVMCKALIDIRKENNVGEKASFFVWTVEMFLNSIYLSAFIFSGNIPMILPHNSQGALFEMIWITTIDRRSLRSWSIKWTDESTLDKDSSVHYFDLPWSKWSLITDPDLDHLKGTHPQTSILGTSFEHLEFQFSRLTLYNVFGNWFSG